MKLANRSLLLSVFLFAGMFLLASCQTPPVSPQTPEPVLIQPNISPIMPREGRVSPPEDWNDPRISTKAISEAQRTGHFLELKDGSFAFYLGNQKVAVFSDSEMSYTMKFERDQGVLIRVNFVESETSALVGEDPLGTRFNFIIGNDPDEWNTNVATYESLRYESIWSGIDLVYYGTLDGLKYEYIVSPDADPSRIVMNIDGADGISTEDGGKTLVLDTEAGSVRDTGLYVFDETGDEVDAQFVVEGTDVGFSVGGYEGVLHIDPYLVFSTFIGGSRNDYISTNTGDWGIQSNLVTDENGSAYICGTTTSGNYPTTTGAYNTSYNGGVSDGFVSKLSPNGASLIFSTFFGGTGQEETVMDIERSNNTKHIYMTGATGSSDFPVSVGAYDETLNGTTDAFVFVLTNNGTNMVWGTYIGGSDRDFGTDLALDSDDRVYLVGSSRKHSTNDWPTTVGAYQPAHGENGEGHQDGVFAVFSSDGSTLEYSTFLGGDDNGTSETCNGVVINTGDVYNDTAYITGTAQGNFPVTTGAYNETFGGDDDAFITLIKPDNDGVNDLIYSTYVGGISYDTGHDVAIDAYNYTYITGRTQSINFPTTSGAYDEVYNTDRDVYLFKILPESGQSPVFSTFIGSSGSDVGNSLELDSYNCSYIVGSTKSSGFPMSADAYNSTFGGDKDAFVLKMSADGSDLSYSTFLGGSREDRGNAIGLYNDRTTIYVAGSTKSNNYPTTAGAYNETHSEYGNWDVFLTRISFDLLAPNIFDVTNMTGVDINEEFTISATINENRTDDTGVFLVNISFYLPGYGIYVNFTMTNTTAFSVYNYTSSTVQAEVVHIYTIYAWDVAGNVNSSLAYTAYIGNVPNITAVTDVGSVDITESFTIYATVNENRTGDSGVFAVNVTLMLGAVNSTYVMTNATFSLYSWTGNILTGGVTYTYLIDAWDVVGNHNVSAIYTLYIGNIPDIEAFSTPDDIHPAAVWTVFVNISDEITGDSGLDHINMTIEVGGVNSTYQMTIATGEPWDYTWSGAIYTEGDFYYWVTALDNVGNTNTSDTRGGVVWGYGKNWERTVETEGTGANREGRTWGNDIPPYVGSWWERNWFNVILAFTMLGIGAIAYIRKPHWAVAVVVFVVFGLFLYLLWFSGYGYVVTRLGEAFWASIEALGRAFGLA